MAHHVERLREELMESLGIGVERNSPPPSAAPFTTRSTRSAYYPKGDEPGCEYEGGRGGRGGRGGGGGGGRKVVAELGGKIRRRSSNKSTSGIISSSRSDGMMMGAREQQQQQHTRTPQQDPGGYYYNNNRTRTGGGGGNLVDNRKRARPASATSRAPISSGRVRPASASSARRPSDDLRPVNDTTTRKNSKEMDVLLEICRHKERGFSLDPADFDSSISAICNLPIGPFAGASREGWGKYFRELHGGSMRAKKSSTTATHESGGPLPMKRRTAAVKSSPTRVRRRLPPERRRGGKWGHHQRPPPAAKLDRKNNNNNNNNSSSGVACRTANPNTNLRQQINGPDDLAASRERAAAKRAAEESVVWRMEVRLQTLWQELKIPEPDRAYITATYLGGSGSGRMGAAIDAAGGPCPGREKGRTLPTSDEVNLELVRQIRLLLDYRASTIKVLRSVTLRESRLTEVEQALQAFQWHRGRDTDAVGLVEALAGLRGASLGVVRAVVEWRQKLWQPRAFCWRGVNYLQKMAWDTRFLRSPVGRSLLASVGLAVADMEFVLFPSTDVDEEDDESSGTGREGRGEEPADVRAPPPIVRLTPKAGLASEYRARFFAQPVAAAAAEAGGEAGGFLGDDADGGGGRRREVEVVVQEAALQRRVEAERARLATKGCFVPLLRWLPAGQSVPYAKTRRSSSSSIPPPAESARETTNTDSRHDIGGTDEHAPVARGLRLPPAASSSTLPLAENTPSTAATAAESSGRRLAGRCASTTSQEVEEPAVDAGEVVVGASTPASHGGVLGARNSIAERDDESETNTTAGTVGQVVEKEEEEGEEEAGEGGGERRGQRALAGEGNAPLSDRLGQTRLPSGDDGKRWEPDEVISPLGGDASGGEDRAGDQSRPAENLPSGSQPIGSEHLRSEACGTARGRTAEEPREPRLTREEANRGDELSTPETRGRSEGGGPTVHTGQATNNAKPEQGAATDSTAVRRSDRREEGNVRREAENPVGDGAAGRGYAQQAEPNVDAGVHEERSSEVADGSGVDEPRGNHKVGGGGDGGGGSREVDRGGARGGHSLGKSNDHCDGSVAPSVMYASDFEDDAQDSSLTRSEGGAASSCRESSSPVGGGQGAPTTEEGEREDMTQTAEGGGDAFSEGGKTASSETEQERWMKKEHQNTAARRIQRLMMRTTRQKRVQNRRVENGKGEVGATDQQAWLAAWRARRETPVSRTETDAAIRIQSTARKKRASDEVNERRRNHATRILDATVNIQAFARRWKAYRREAVQEVEGARKDAARRQVAPGTSEEQQQQTLVGEDEERGSRSVTRSQPASRQKTRESPHQSPKNVTSIGAASSVGSGQDPSDQWGSAKERKVPEKVQGGSSAVSSSSKELPANNSYSSLTLTSPGGGRRSPSFGSEGSSSSGLLGSLNSSRGDDDDDDDNIVSSSVVSDVSAGGGAKQRLGERGQRNADDGGREEKERRDIGFAAVSDKVPPSSSSSSLVEATAAAATEPTQPQRKEGVSAVGAGEGGDRTTAKVGDAPRIPDDPVILSLPLSMDDEASGGEARPDSAGGPPPSSFSSDPDSPMIIGASTLVALSPVPEERALSVAAASVSEYGSDDLNFEALSSSHEDDSQIAASVGTEATKGATSTIGRDDSQETEARGTAGGTESVPNSGRVEGVEETGEDSDGSLMSLSASSDD